ncbi:CehA/McbA family metallohydrolase [[Eubacterium] cellulosolvens]
MMKLDLHVHTKYSADGSVEPGDYIKQARKIGLNGFAITDHNEVKGAARTFKLAKGNKDLIIIRGIEVSSSEGHILGYGVTELIPRGLGAEETIEQIVDAGGVVVAAHPFRHASGLGSGVVKRVKFNSVEILNHRSMHRENQRAKLLAAELKAGITGGSDAHFVKELGLAATEFSTNPKTEDEVISEISKKNTKPIGKDSTLGQGIIMYSKLIVHWIKRGMRRV